MKTLTTIITASVFALGALTSAGCAVATAGIKKGDERNFARSLNDVNASRAIRARMHRTDGFKLSGVDVEVAEGIVVLSGNVPRAEDRIEAERIAWSANRIVQVGNEIQIKGKQGHVRNAKDGILNKAIRARLVANSAVKARNYNIEVNDGIVYLLGVARTPNELAAAAHTVSTTRGAREVISYVRITGDNSAQHATGPGFKGQPSNVAQNRSTYTPPAASALPYSSPLPSPQPYSAMPLADPTPLPAPSRPLDNDAIESGEPYFRDPVTGERVEIPEGVTPIPYVPDTGPGSLGAGGSPLPPGAQVSGSTSMAAIPSDEHLGQFRTGKAGEAVSVIESAPYMLDPATGKMVPVNFIAGQWVPQIIK